MEIIKENGITILVPEKDKRLTNGFVTYAPNQKVYIAISDTPDNWRELDEITLSIWSAKNNNFVLNPNGSMFCVTPFYDTKIGTDVLKIDYDTNNYCGGTVIRDIKKAYKKARIEYSSDVDVRIHLQYNDKSYNNYVIFKATEGYSTIDVDIDEEIFINHFEFYVSTENGDKANGILYIKDISFVD